MKPAGRYGISVSTDNTLRVWFLIDGILVATFSGEGSLEACVAGHDSRTMVAGGAAGHVHFLRLKGVGQGA